jgi:hypothetical protein
MKKFWTGVLIGYLFAMITIALCLLLFYIEYRF